MVHLKHASRNCVKLFKNLETNISWLLSLQFLSVIANQEKSTLQVLTLVFELCLLVDLIVEGSGSELTSWHTIFTQGATQKTNKHPCVFSAWLCDTLQLHTALSSFQWKMPNFPAQINISKAKNRYTPPPSSEITKDNFNSTGKCSLSNHFCGFVRLKCKKSIISWNLTPSSNKFVSIVPKDKHMKMKEYYFPPFSFFIFSHIAQQ